MAVKKVIEIEVDGSGAISGIDKLNKAVDVTEQSTKSLRTQLREAQLEVATLSEKFGATSKEAIDAAKKAALLKDTIADAKTLTDAYNPDAKFNALGGALSGVAGGFSAVQGALGTLGVESENTEKMILRVNSAMALSQGLNALLESRESFKNLGKQAADAFKAIRTGIGSTGIGLLVVAVGTLVVYWDDIKEAISGVSEAQKELNEQTNANYETSKKQLDTLNDQDNTLKLQGKSEKEILQLKIKQYNETIKIAEANLKNIKTTNDAAIKGAERNFNIFKKILQYTMEFSLVAVRAIALPLELMIMGVNKVSQLISGKKAIDFSIEGKITEGKNFLADFVAGSLFDVEEIKQQGEDDYQKALKEINSLKNKRDGLTLELNKPSEKAKAEKTKTQKGQKINIEDSPELIREQMIAKTRMEMKKIFDDEDIQREKDKNERLYNESLKKEQWENTFAENEMLIAQTVHDHKLALLDSTSNALMLASEIAGQQTGVGKALAVASTVISTYSAAQKAYESAFLPVPTYLSPIIGRVNQGIAIATGLMNVKKILSVKTPTGNGSNSNSVSPSLGGASATPSPQFNLTNNSGVNQIATTLAGQQPVKAYVVAKEVTTAQELDRNKITSTKLG